MQQLANYSAVLPFLSSLRGVGRAQSQKLLVAAGWRIVWSAQEEKHASGETLPAPLSHLLKTPRSDAPDLNHHKAQQSLLEGVDSRVMSGMDYTAAFSSHWCSNSDLQTADVESLVSEKASARVDLPTGDSTTVATNLITSAIEYRKAGNLVAALALAQRGLKLLISKLGEESADTVMAEHLTGTLMHEIGDLDAALDHKRRALDTACIVHKDTRPADIAMLHYSLAITLHKLTRYDEALFNDRLALHIRIELFGMQHADTVASLYSIGVTTMRLGRPLDALSYFRQVAHTRCKILGATSTDTAMALSAMGNTLVHLLRYDEALSHFEQAAHIHANVSGYSHPDAAKALLDVGTTLHNLQKFEEALKHKAVALSILHNALGTEHSLTCNCMASVSATLHTLNRLEDALVLDQQLLKGKQAVFGEHDISTAEAHTSLAITLHKLDRQNEALEHDMLALDIMKKVHGPTHLTTATALDNVGGALHSLGRFEHASVVRGDALRVWREIAGERDVRTAQAMVAAAETLTAMSCLDEALVLLEAAVSIRQQMLGDEHPDTIHAAELAGDTLHNLGRHDEALEHAQRSFDQHVFALNRCMSTDDSAYGANDVSKANQLAPPDESTVDVASPGLPRKDVLASVAEALGQTLGRAGTAVAETAASVLCGKQQHKDDVHRYVKPLVQG